MPNYTKFPGVDDQLQFAPEVKAALVRSTEMQAELSNKVGVTDADAKYVSKTGLTEQRGAPNGLAYLNADQKIPAELLPNIIGGGTLSGRYIERPAPATVTPGTVFYSTDTTETFRANGTDWVVVGSGGTLGTAVLMTEWGTTSTDVLVPVPGLSVGCTVPVRGVKITASGQWNLVAGANAAAYIVISVNGNDGPHIIGRWAVSNTEINYSRTAEVQNLVPGSFATFDVKVMIDYRNKGNLYMISTDYNPHNLIVEAL